MSKRGPGGAQPPKPRKRKKGGLSTSMSLLDPGGAPSSKPPVMRVWHTNAEEPAAVRLSTVPIPSLPQTGEPDASVNDEDDFFTVPAPTSVPTQPKQKKKNDSTKMQTWASLSQTILDELLRWDGLRDYTTLPQCKSCVDGVGKYRCRDCVSSVLFCPSCLVSRHENLPLHRLEFWNGRYFERGSLNDLNYCFHIGHMNSPCPAASRTQVIVVVDVSGIHHVRVQFCACVESPGWVEKYLQLLRVGWYPASFERPRTVFTFDVLDTYHKLALQGKLNLYDFYMTVQQKSDNCGRTRATNRYHEMSRCVRQWRLLKQAKRGGGGHISAGIASIESGALAVECPACPHPGRNLPEDWDTCSEELRWLYTIFLAIDGNYRLKLKSRGIEDPEIGSGWSYFVECLKYNEHIAKSFTEGEAAGCGSDFHAVGRANANSSKNYIASGVIACVCARHCFMQKNGIGDLQVKERYTNTDYIVASVLKHVSALRIVLSYDIVCKWAVHFLQRLSEQHPNLDVTGLELIYLIPKFHLPGHGASCQTNYSFNYAKGVGRTHGETVEHGWANMNLAALSTREMGPGARHLALDDAWGGWNWKKVLGMGESLLRNLLTALLMKRRHATENKKFDATIPEKLREGWLVMIRNWESNKSNPNPYAYTERASNLAEARRKLAQADDEELRRGTASHRAPASVFVREGLEIEEQQKQLKLAIKINPPKSESQVASVQEKRNSLMRRIKKWQELQLIYMPKLGRTPFRVVDDSTGVAGDDAETFGDATETDASKDGATGDNSQAAEAVQLFLPSSLEPEVRKVVCPQQVVEHERLLRLAQLQDSLIELRHTRKIRHKLRLNHNIEVAPQGVRANTRSRTVMNSIENRITKFVHRYRAAYEALHSLDPKGTWNEQYLELRDRDNRGPGKEEDEEGTGDGSFFRSWIWLVNPRRSNATANGEDVAPDGVAASDGEAASDEEATLDKEAASDEDVNEVIRVEWTTSFARYERWAEEVELLQEEMRRVVAFLEWKSRDWLAKRDVRRGLASDIQCGLTSYAEKQTAIYDNLAVSFTRLWYPTLVSYGLKHTWATDFLANHKVSTAIAKVPTIHARGIFKFRLSPGIPSASTTVEPTPCNTSEAVVTTNEDDYPEDPSRDDDSGTDESDSEQEFELEDDLDLNW